MQKTGKQQVLLSPFQPPFFPWGQWKGHLLMNLVLKLEFLQEISTLNPSDSHSLAVTIPEACSCERVNLKT